MSNSHCVLCVMLDGLSGKGHGGLEPRYTCRVCGKVFNRAGVAKNIVLNNCYYIPSLLQNSTSLILKLISIYKVCFVNWPLQQLAFHCIALCQILSNSCQNGLARKI